MKILLIEDHKLISQALQKEIEENLIDSKVDIINTKTTLDDILNKIEYEKYDLILMDIFIERIIPMSGLDLTMKITSKFKFVKVLILTGYDKRYYRQKASKSGAIGYVFKGAEIKELIKAIKDVEMGKHITINTDANLNALDQCEIEVVKLYSDGLTREQVAKKLNISKRTLANRLVIIYQKLDVSNYQEMVSKALKEGYISF